MNSIISICFLLLSLIYISEGYKILVFYPTPIKSINILGDGIVRHLLKAGHEVTYVTAFPIDWGPNVKIRQIDVSSGISMIENDDSINIGNFLESSNPSYSQLYYQTFGKIVGDLTFSNENVTTLLEDTTENFDVIIIDYYENDVFSGLSAVFDCPFIWTFSINTNWLPLRLIDEPSNPAYSVYYISSNLPPLNFLQRVEELWSQLQWFYYKWSITMPLEKQFYEDFFTPLIKKRGKIPPLYEDLVFNASLLFCNDFNIAGIVPKTPQNFKLIGGQHINTPTKPLPADLQNIMDNSEHGVIYFSMGSTWKAKTFPSALLQNLLKMFSELKCTVIWKFEENIMNLPKNVHIVKWAPQQSILAHPKLKVFITHSGQLSSVEVVHFGVPIIGIPISVDQVNNIKRAVRNGYAIEVKLSYDLPKTLKEALNVVLSDSTYKQKAQKASALYHDRLVPPGKEIAYWVEHVVRTGGAPHLRSPGLHVPLYQKLFLDLVAVVFIALALILIGIRIILKSILQVLLRNIKSDKKNN